MNDNEKRDFCTGCGLLPQRPVKPKAPVCGCKKKKCCKKNCCDTEFVFRKVVIPAALGDDETGKAKPENGAYTNSYVEYEANGAQYMYDSYGIYTKIEPGSEGTLDFNELENRPRYAGIEMTGETDIPDFSDSITALQGSISDEQEARISADNGLQTQIDALSAASDVTDIVGTYAELEAYDTSKLNDNDIIKVLQDETHDDETTYYRWVKATSSFTLIGEEGPYYTKAAADQKFQDKLTAGDGVTIDSDNVISADGETIFYANLNETGTTRHIYKDINFTSAVSAQDIIDANNKGQVILRGTSLVNPTAYSDSYLQNAFIMPHNNDYEFVFLDRDLRHEYTASATTDTAFYYDASEIQPKLTAGTNINISGTTISATDTTYSNFTGTDGVDPGTAGLVPAPATTDAGKYLKADGTWGTVSTGPTVVQVPGTSQTDVMSQNATTEMVFADPSDRSKIRIGSSSTNNANNGICIGRASQVDSTATGGIAIGSASSGTYKATVSGNTGIALGYAANATGAASIALGSYSKTTLRGQIDVSTLATTNTFGYNNSQYRLLTGLYDPQSAQDAATKNYTDNLVISYVSLNGTGAPTTSTAAQYVGQLYYDTTNDDMYYCSAITAQGTTPETYTYTWNTIGGGGGIPTTATFWGASYDATNNKVDGNITLKYPSMNAYAGIALTGASGNNATISIHTGDSYINKTQTTYGTNYVTTYVGSTAITEISSAGMSMNSKKITSLADPTAAQDAATKNYVDTAVASAGATPITNTQYNDLWSNA